jgi:hypothetical protein
MGRRSRRLLPGVIVGSGALVGTGALMAWVGDRPGMHPTSTAAPTASAKPANEQSNREVLSELNQQLRLETSEVGQLESALAQLNAARRAAAAHSGHATTVMGGPSPGGPAPGSSTANPTASAAPGALPSIGSIGSVNLPSIPPITPIAVPAPSAPSTPPATNATTGASHAVP